MDETTYTLTKTEREFADRWNLTIADLIGFKEDMEMADELERGAERDMKRIAKENQNSPQAIYPAW